MYQFHRLFRFVLILSAIAWSASDAAPLRVIATTTLIADAARAVGGPDADVTALIPPGTDPHAFDPGPRDMARLLSSDLVLANGLGLETFLQKILDAAGVGQSNKLVIVSSGREPRGGCSGHDHDGEDESESENEGEDDQRHHHHHDADPHVWFDPTWVQLWTENIAAAFAARDPANADAYRARAAAFRADLDALDAELRAAIDAIPAERRVLVTDHDEFGYLADRYEIRVVGAILPNVTTVAEPSARELAALQRAMRESGTRVIVVGHSANPALAERLARDVGARVIRLQTHTLGPAGSPTAHYIGFMRHNVERLVEAWRETQP